jgi:hypothetical protein
MKCLIKIGALGLVLMVLFSCGNKDKITLQYDFKQGEVLKQNMVINMDLVQKFMNQEMKVSITMGMKMTFEVKESRDSDYTLEVRYKELKVEAGMPGVNVGKITFDSNTADSVATETNLGPMFKAIVDKPFETVMDKTGKVKSVKGLETCFENMINTFSDSVPESFRQQTIGQFGSQFSEEAFKSQFEQTTGYLPDKPVGIGDSWNTKLETKASSFAITVDAKLTLKSVEDNVVNVDLDGTVATPEGYEQEIKGMKTKIALKGTYKGTLKLNRNTGWIVFSDMMMNINGDIEVMGMKVPVYTALKATVTDEF